jgi:hypothetical protein
MQLLGRKLLGSASSEERSGDDGCHRPSPDLPHLEDPMFVRFDDRHGDIAIGHIVRIVPTSGRTCEVYLTPGHSIGLDMSRTDALKMIEDVRKGE